MSSTLIKPDRLRPGDTLGIISPSSPTRTFFPERFDHALRQIETLGFRTVVGPCASQSEGYRSAPVRDRAEEIHAFLRDDSVHGIVAALGGSNSNSIIPFLDWSLIRRKPKVFVGYSDVTALLLAIHAQTGLVTFHGPALLPSFGEWPGVAAYTRDSFLRAVTDTGDGRPACPFPPEWTEERLEWRGDSWKSMKKTQPNQGWRCLREGSARGALVGGNLNTFCGFIGTRYFPAIDGTILFIEESYQGLASLERSLYMLRLHKVFDVINGLLVGKMEKLDGQNAPFGASELILEATDGFDFPILSEVDLGHTSPMLTLPIGCPAFLDSAKGILRLEDSGVR